MFKIGHLFIVPGLYRRYFPLQTLYIFIFALYHVPQVCDLLFIPRRLRVVEQCPDSFDRLRMLDGRGEVITGPLEDMFLLKKVEENSE